MASTPVASSAPAAPQGVWPPAPVASASYGVSTLAVPTAPGIGRMIAGFALAAVLGIVGTVIWIAITIALHRDWAMIAIGVGWLCGFGALKGVGQGGKAAAVIGTVTALGATLIGAFMLGGGTPGIFEWFCVAVGTYEGYIVPTRAARRGQ